MVSSPHFTLPALLRARDLIDREYATPLDLDAMAREAGYSRYHFAHAFAAAYGEPPRAYLTRRRVERAKSLLRAANLSVTEVCFMVGFESLGSFSTLFKRLVGQSPSEYQASAARAGGAPPIPGCVVLMWTRPYPQTQQAARSPTPQQPPKMTGIQRDQPDVALLLAVPAPPMFTPDDAHTVQALVAKGAFSGGVLETDDCQATYEHLKASGVTFLQEPSERPYGVEAVFRDDSGNWFSLTQRSGNAD